VLPDDDTRHAIETCRISESVLKWFKVNNFRLIHNIQLVRLLVMWYLVNYSSIFNFFTLIFSAPTYCRCRELFLHLNTLIKHTTLSGTPLDVWSPRRRNLYLTAYNKHKRRKSMPPAGFESAIPTTDRPQTERQPGSYSFFLGWFYVVQLFHAIRI
jgi:hypothetical protein